MKTPTLYLKRFAVWVTDLTDNYRFNPFVQATINIVLIQLLLAILLIAISGWAIQYAQNNTVGSISYHLAQIVRGTPTATTSLPNAIQGVRNRTLTYIFIGLVTLIALFGYLIIRFAVAPARASALLQKRFIGNIAHEVRTPLAIMKTNTEVALMDPALMLAPALRDILHDNIAEMDRVSEIINNLLSFDKLIRPSRIKTELVDLGAIVETVTKRHEALAMSRNVTLSIHLNKNRFVMGNTSALDQVATNLLKNAINYTPVDQDGIVSMSLESDYRGWVVLVVSDTGIGIAQKDLYRVFEPFYRGDTSRARGIGTGTSGLGLAIVNEIVRLHHGSISIKSATGQGTTVSIALPPAPTAEAAETPVISDTDKGVNEVSVDFS